MKLRNKKTGEIGYTAVLRSKAIVVMDENAIQLGSYTSLAELNADWEDVPEEPKGIQCIYYVNHFEAAKLDGVIVGFETKEEAEKAVEKLKAWKRLKDNYHISFNLDFAKNNINFTYQINDTLHSVVNEERIVFEEMKTIFGDKE